MRACGPDAGVWQGLRYTTEGTNARHATRLYCSADPLLGWATHSCFSLAESIAEKAMLASRSRIVPGARILSHGRCRCAAPLAIGRRRCLATATDRVKRFYKQAGIAPAKDGSDRFVVTLDGRTLKTPQRTEVLLPTEAAAVAIAAEWESQDTHIMPHLMPLNRLAMTALDIVPKTRESIIDGIMPYLDTDTVWFWEDPERYTLSHQLHALQDETYTPILDWMENRFGSRPETTTALMVEQPEALISSVKEWVDGLDDWQLAALDQAVRALKSMCLATALLQYHLSPEDAAKYEPMVLPTIAC